MEALSPSRRVRAACAAARADLRAGSTLAEALGERPGLTTAQQRALLRSGQESGRLDHAVALIDHAIGSAARLRRALVGRLIYPLILLVAAVGAVWLLSARVIPQFADTLASLGGELPWQTELTLALGSRLTWALPALAAAALGAWLARPLWLTPALRARLAAWALRVPVLGSLLWHAQAAMITDVVATMIRGGADLLSGLREAHEVVSSPVIAERLELARRDVREGADLAAALADRAVLPPMINAVVGAGLRAGDLAGALRRASDLCAERQEHVAGRLLVFLEPGVILLLAGAVGWVVYSLVVGMLAVTDAGGL
jgi:type II secretory pathway component PulF